MTSPEEDPGGPERTRSVLLVASSWNLLGGAEHCLVDVATNLAATGWTPVVVVPAEGTLADALRAASVTVVVVPLGVLRHRGEARSPVLVGRLITALIASRRLVTVMRRYDVEVVHSNAAGVVAGAIAARTARVPHIWHVREILTGRVWRLLRSAMFAWSTRIVCISEAVARHVLEGGGKAEKVVVLRDGLDLSVFHPAEHARPSHEVMMLSRIHPEKGHEEFLRAAALVAARVPDARFTMAGGCLPIYDDLRRHLEARIVELGLAGRAVLAPGMTRQAAAEALRRADVAVVPSIVVEGGGLVVMEAMASGVAVVAPDRGGPVELVHDGVDGFLVDPTDTPRLAAVIESLLVGPDIRAAVTARALERVRVDLDLQIHVRRLAQLYTAVTSGPPVTRCA